MFSRKPKRLEEPITMLEIEKQRPAKIKLNGAVLGHARLTRSAAAQGHPPGCEKPALSYQAALPVNRAESIAPCCAPPPLPDRSL